MSRGIGNYDGDTAQGYDARGRDKWQSRWIKSYQQGQRWWRIASANPHFGVLGMLGVYAACGAIFDIVDTRRPEMIREIDKCCDFRRASGRRIFRF